ncbi:MAG: hypothetical protein FD163_396 [Hyphomonadaceae bacterium]|nr:MAG: hypothetical protein FD128_11 [Hyphomonadaceae bacterium]KAF0187121.1 MAG: hypothetical protein FD163_396 [Hyphomonadaceae bacterium]
MKKKTKSGIGPILIIILLGIGLAATNPSRDHFKSVMRDQKSLKLELASRLPMHRTNYVLFSKFDIKYGIGKTTCYGAAAFVFFCPKRAKNEPSTEAAATGNE